MDKTEEELEQELQDLMKEANDERDGGESDEDELDLDNDDKELDEENEDDDNDDSDDNDDENEDNLDDDDDSEDDKEEEDEDEIEDNFEPIEVEISGVKVAINSKDELIGLATKGLSSVNVTPNSESEVDNIVNQGKLSKEDLTLLIDAKNGDANAISKLAQLGKIDVLDIDENKAEKYTPAFEVEQVNEVNKVAGEILSDVEHATEFKQISNNVPQNFINEISSDASKLRAFSGHIKSGLAQKIIPEAMKKVATDGGDFYDAYASIGAELSKSLGKEESGKPEKKTRTISEKEKKLRERANDNNTDNGDKIDTTAADIWSMNEDEFQAMIAKG